MSCLWVICYLVSEWYVCGFSKAVLECLFFLVLSGYVISVFFRDILKNKTLITYTTHHTTQPNIHNTRNNNTTQQHNNHNNHNNHNKSWPLVSRLEPMAVITSQSPTHAHKQHTSNNNNNNNRHKTQNIQHTTQIRRDSTRLAVSCLDLGTPEGCT